MHGIMEAIKHFVSLGVRNSARNRYQFDRKVYYAKDTGYHHALYKDYDSYTIRIFLLPTSLNCTAPFEYFNLDNQGKAGTIRMNSFKARGLCMGKLM